MAAGSVIAFWAVALLLIIVPGADWAFTISSGLRGHSALAAVSGIVLGYAGITVVVAAGVGALVARSPAILTALTITGGLYLIWHGSKTFARPETEGTPADPPARTSRASAPANRSTLVRGMGVSALNPKGLLLFLALLPQFTSPRWSWPVAVQLGFLGLVFMVTCAAFYLGLGSFAGKILHARPAAAGAVTRFSGAAMIVIGALLLAERLIT
jgi:threonine/homoserine/homoserine lactone efflux protein